MDVNDSPSANPANTSQTDPKPQGDSGLNNTLNQLHVISKQQPSPKGICQNPTWPLMTLSTFGNM